MHACPDCNTKCNCPTGEESLEFCTHCAEKLLGSVEEDGSYLDLSDPHPEEELDEEKLDEENFI